MQCRSAIAARRERVQSRSTSCCVHKCLCQFARCTWQGSDHLCMGWRRLPTLLAHIPLRTQPLSEKQKTLLEQTDHLPEIVLKTIPSVGKVSWWQCVHHSCQADRCLF